MSGIKLARETLFTEDFRSGARFGDLLVANPFVLSAHEPLACAAVKAAHAG